MPISEEISARLRILIADDNSDLAQSLALLLEGKGHETRVVYDGMQAMEAAADFRPHLVLLDIEMPRLDGYGVAQWIRGQSWGKSIVIAAVSGIESGSSKSRALTVGIDHFYTKPIRSKQLAQLVERTVHAE